MEEVKKAAGVLAPVPGNVLVLAVTSTAAAVDLSAWVGCYVTIKAETATVYYKCDATSGTADDVDDTATSGNNRADAVPSGGRDDFIVSGTYPFLGYKTASGSTATLRVKKSSNRS